MYVARTSGVIKKLGLKKNRNSRRESFPVLGSFLVQGRGPEGRNKNTSEIDGGIV